MGTPRVSLPERYRYDGPIAAGGMAAVYAAHDTVLQRPVAVKVLAEHLGADGSARQRFQREARAAAGLSSHPNVVTIFDVGEHDGRSFMVMELMEGGTLAERLRDGARPDRETALRWLRDAASAIDAAHERGIVHRDIKPGNLLLNDKGDVAVADFGIARLAEEDAITAPGTVLGTAAYISPEQALGEPATDASDRYSLGVVAYELLTGTKPFDAENFAAQARAQIEDPAPRPSERNRDLSPEVDDVVGRALAKNPADRWPTATAFVNALEDALGAPRTAVTTPLAEGRFPRTATPTPSRPLPPPRAPRRASNVPLLALAGGLLLVALAAVLIAGLGRGDGGRQTDRTPAETPSAKKKAKPAATSTAESGQQEEQPDQQSGAPAPAGEDPSALNAQGFELFQQGRYEEAVPFFEKAVESCGNSGAVDPCAFAMYNLGASLNRSGRSEEAIPVLQTRLDRWDNQEGVVRKELASACQAADADCGDLKGKKGKREKDD